MIYYVEDDTNIRELTVYALVQGDVPAQGFEDAASFLAACEKQIPDAALLDIMLPDKSGLEILAHIRSTPELETLPVMMITARDTEADIVAALDAGADSYLAKPFGMREMVSRVKALLRRSKGEVGDSCNSDAATSATLVSGELTMDLRAHQVTLDGKVLNLTLREFELLEFLLENPHVAFTREELMQRVWGWEFDGGSRTVDVHIQTLRSKLGDFASHIETVRGVGYRYED